MTVYENIASPMRIAKVPRRELDAKVREAAELLKLTPYLERTPLNLSGGQQQRTALARALVKGAELVLLDEPLANLDYKLREELREELPRLFAETGAVFVYATTEPHEALLLGGNTATLHEGARHPVRSDARGARPPGGSRHRAHLRGPSAQRRRRRQPRRPVALRRGAAGRRRHLLWRTGPTRSGCAPTTCR